MRSHLVGEGPLMTDNHASEERALQDTIRRLSLAYPSASPEHISATLRADYAATKDAKVQTYRLLLAERNTRVRLRHETHPAPQRSWAWDDAG